MAAKTPQNNYMSPSPLVFPMVELKMTMHLSALAIETTVEVQSLEHIGGHDVCRPEANGGIDESFLQKTSEAITDQLGCQELGTPKVGRAWKRMSVRSSYGSDR